MAAPSTTTGKVAFLPAATLLSSPVTAANRAEETGSCFSPDVFLDRKVQLASMRVDAAATLALRLTEVVSR
ncbi:hypothetical protein SALBM217S_09322 [Streptomyces griseoloalbus]